MAVGFTLCVVTHRIQEPPRHASGRRCNRQTPQCRGRRHRWRDAPQFRSRLQVAQARALPAFAESGYSLAQAEASAILMHNMQ
jgi:hypothetical protein